MNNYSAIKDYHKLCIDVLNMSNKPIPRMDYFCTILERIKKYISCDSMELGFEENGNFQIWNINESGESNVITIPVKKTNGQYLPEINEDTALNVLKLMLLKGEFNSNLCSLSQNSSLWIENSAIIKENFKKYTRYRFDKKDNNFNYDSFALVQIKIDTKISGFMHLMSKKKGFFDQYKIAVVESIAQVLGVSIQNKRVQGALRERVKELSCLYNISQFAAKDDLSLDKILHQIANLIPPAWQYPKITIGQISLDNNNYFSPGDYSEHHFQEADIEIKGEKRGKVKTIYTENKPESDEGPFLNEERNLINAIAKQVAFIVERRESEKAKLVLQEQIRHADRLATIGQLSAGVAHELNEPLGNILGFAQLTKKYPGLPSQAYDDIEKIITASLNAREIIKKLMLFSRQMPPKRGRVSINDLIEQGLYFFEARCIKGGINLIRTLDEKIPIIEGDSGQLNQVLVNLVVNSIQAMPNGGNLTISTFYNGSYISIIVEDTGEGIGDSIKQKIFLPFFTTKDVDEGTGLGLAVVHGIVLSHRGSINVESKVGKGSRFEIKLPIS